MIANQFRMLSVFFAALLCGFGTVFGQETSKMLYGKILNEEEVSGIHVLNTATHWNTITNEDGNFRIMVRVKDTLIISSIKYAPEKRVITQKEFDEGLLYIKLSPMLNELEEVYLGPRLTGDLSRDIAKIKVEDPLNFDDVGIPGFKGKPEEKIPNLIGQVITPTAVNIEGLYKHISGYYRKLKIQRKWEGQNVVAAQIMHHFGEDHFSEIYGIPTEYLYDFMLFCIETSTLKQDFQDENMGKLHAIFEEKAVAYTARLQEYEELDSDGNK